MDLNLNVEFAVDQDDLQSEMVKHLDLTYQEVERQMCDLGFYQGNGDVHFCTKYPREGRDANDVSIAMHAFMLSNGYDSIRVYEDH